MEIILDLKVFVLSYNVTFALGNVISSLYEYTLKKTGNDRLDRNHSVTVEIKMNRRIKFLTSFNVSFLSWSLAKNSLFLLKLIICFTFTKKISVID